MVSVEEDDLAGLEDVSSDGEDDNYEAELTDNETASFGATAVKKPYRKRSRGLINCLLILVDYIIASSYYELRSSLFGISRHIRKTSSHGG